MVTLQVEHQLISEYGPVACLDEVGRGALAGPVCVGAVLLDDSVGLPPPGVADSKDLTARKRSALLDPLKEWVSGWSVGSASAEEIDEVGIMAALQSAAWRAIAGLPNTPAVLLLDGPYDYVSTEASVLPVETKVKADSYCAGVAAASIFAKQHRDDMMVELARKYPQYGWERNVGYGSAQHRAAIREHGVTAAHRRTWKLT